jgi:hypothetical protein
LVVTAQPSFLELAGQRLAEAGQLARQTRKAAVLVLQQFPVAEAQPPLVPPVRESIANILAFAEVGEAADAAAVVELAGDRLDVIALDCDQKLPQSRAIVETVERSVPPERLLRYSDNQAWFDSALDMVQRLSAGVTGRTGVVAGSGYIADQLRYVLPRLGAHIEGADANGHAERSDFVLGAAQKQPCITRALLDRVPGHAAVYDLGIGTLFADAADRARARGLNLYRLDNRAGISSAIIRLLETDYMVRRLMGRVRVRDVDIVAGGLLAPAGAVVVDDISNPTVVFGVSDGEGRFRSGPLSPEDTARMDFVRSLIVKVH